MRSTAQSAVRFLRYVDTFILAAVAAYVWGGNPMGHRWDLALVIYLVPVCASLLKYYGLYESHRIEGAGQVVRGLLSGLLAGLALSVVGVFFARLENMLWNLLQFFGLSLLILGTVRVGMYCILAWARAKGYDRREVCLIGDQETARELGSRFGQHQWWGLDLTYWGVPPDQEMVRPDSPLTIIRLADGVEAAANFEELLRTHPLDEVVFATDLARLEAFRPLLACCHQAGVSARLMLAPTGDVTQETPRQQLDYFAGGVALAVSGSSHNTVSLYLKRLIDIAGSLMLLIPLLPVLIITSLLVKLSSPGPIIFINSRLGRHGRPFKMLKFRTMVDGADGLMPAMASRNITEGPTFKDRQDWRVTPVGRWLRRFSIDELPQLWNVLMGDMSLVGPRPLPLREARDVAGGHRRRFTVRPGLTCLWQVSGRSEIPFEKWMALDLQYVDTWSLWVDLKLLARTIPAVLSGRGAY